MHIDFETVKATVKAFDSSLELEPVSGGFSVIVEGVRVTLKEKGNFKVYFNGKRSHELREALIAANLELTAERLAAGRVKFTPASAETYPKFISSVRAVIRGAATEALAVPANIYLATKTHDFSNNPEKTMPILPENLILYGPPGTGKTFTTAAEAVRLCGEPVPEDRKVLMDAYQRLVESGRIEFVTFHQSMSYEEFIEGRQPMTGTDESEETHSAGFRLETVPGVFRRIAKRAEISRGLCSGSSAITVAGRQIFKMSIGRANSVEDSKYFDEAIQEGYTLLGWEDIDWSDDRYSDPREILETCRNRGKTPGGVTAQSGQVEHTDLFRNHLRIGDIIVVSKGNHQFRAIGLVKGDYEYQSRPEQEYTHKRAVQWLWIDNSGMPVNEIYHNNFTQRTIYRLKPSGINIPALERYMNSGNEDGAGEPEPFVIIIDEINRANISKVFGELITLLEHDKRLGQDNRLKVRLPYSNDEFGVPSNLHILGTMNTADRSIALLDTALRRRFTFREMMPDPSILVDAANKCNINLARLLETVNERIEYLYDREHQIGHAYFIHCKSPSDVTAVRLGTE